MKKKIIRNKQSAISSQQSVRSSHLAALSSIFLVVVSFIFTLTPCLAQDMSHKAASSLSVVTYARNLLNTIVDSEFRGSWVINPKELEKVQKTTQIIRKSFNSLNNIKVGASKREVKEILGNPVSEKINSKIWIYGKPKQDGTYIELLEVFFDDKDKVTSIISFIPKSVVEDIGVNIGDKLDKIIAAYGEPASEKDFIEDPDNKEFMGLYYLYPRSGVGFLIGQEKETRELLVYGILVFGNQ